MMVVKPTVNLDESDTAADELSTSKDEWRPENCLGPAGVFCGQRIHDRIYYTNFLFYYITLYSTTYDHMF